MFTLLKMKVLISHRLCSFKGKFYNWDESQLQKIKVKKHQWCHGVLFNLVMSDDHALLWSSSNCQRQMCILRGGVVCDSTRSAARDRKHRRMKPFWFFEWKASLGRWADKWGLRGRHQCPRILSWTLLQTSCLSSGLPSCPQAAWIPAPAQFITLISVIY